MILLKISCDKCHRDAAWTAATPQFTPTDVRISAQEEGWRRYKKADLCPECAIKVLGIVGAMCAKT